MVRRTRIAAVLTLAVINVFTLAAGIAVARMLPPRLAALKVPTVAAGPLTVADPVLGSGGTGTQDSPMPTTSGLLTALAGPLSAPALGPHVSALVADPVTGRVLLSEHGSRPMTPASTTKLATGLAALAVLGQNARFTTKVVRGATPGSITLVGGGDPTLAVNPFPAQDYPQPATLASLAKATARTLKAQGRRTVVLGYDTSLYTGPGLAPGWPAAYVTGGDVTPIVPLEVDQGRLTAAGQPEDSDDPYNLAARSQDPAGMAASAFAGLLTADGIHVSGAPQPQTAATRSATLASVTSPPLSALVAQMLEESNNVIAENLARHVAIATGQPASFSGAAAAEMSVLRGLGVTGVHLVDGSGLSPRDRITPTALVAIIGRAAAADQSRLRAAITGLPVAGFSGTLAPGGSVFAEAGRAALGLVRAKTGNLNTVAALAGIAYARNGQLLSFAVMADKLKMGALDQAGAQIARVATALARCGCRAG